MSAGLFDRFVASVVELFDLEGREVVDGAVGAFGVEPHTQEAVAASTWSKSRQGPSWWISSDLYRPICDSARELSYASPTDPTDGSMPSSMSRSVNAIDV